MSLYFIRHQHNEQSCPARDPLIGSMLVSHVSKQNALKYGINLHGDAVLDGQHTFVLIVEAENESKVEKFMQPFKRAGEVEIWPASTCEVVVDRAMC
jgi:hypothetical protein